MLILAVENPSAASGNIFNIVSDRAVTLDGMAKLCAQAAGSTAKIVHYDPKAVGVDAKKAFPFRNMVMIHKNHILPLLKWCDFCSFLVATNSCECVMQHFYAEPRAAKELLGWKSTTYLPEDLKERYEEYVKIGRDQKDMKFEIDDKILETINVSVA